MIEFEGQLYFDDRLYVYSLCRAKVEEGPDETVETTILLDPDDPKAAAATDLVWCLATYWNCPGYRAHSLHHFESKDDAENYLRYIEPFTPLISLNGRIQVPPLAYADYVAWKRKNNLAEYDYKKTFLPGGENSRERFNQSRKQILENKERTRGILEDARRETQRP